MYVYAHPMALQRHWRVGELAAATGLTVRALHHYEDRGLLPPPARTGGGHRLYDRAGIERLYLIRALRELGLSLDEIGRAMQGRMPLAKLLREHLAGVEQQLARLSRLRDRLRSLTASPDAHLDIDDLLETLDAMARIERQGAAVKARVEAWRVLGKRLRACLAAGADPGGARVRRLAAQARALIQQFAGGDPAVVKALARLRHKSPPVALAGWDPELTRYLDRALAALDEE